MHDQDWRRFHEKCISACAHRDNCLKKKRREKTLVASSHTCFLACYKLGLGTTVNRFPCSRQLILDRVNRVFIIWSKRIRIFACRYQKMMPYHLAILIHLVLDSKTEGEGGSRTQRISRAVQEYISHLTILIIITW